MNKYMILVNGKNKMPETNDYNIINANSKYDINASLEEETLNKFIELQQFVYEKGYIIDLESGYRSVDSQIKVWNEIEKEKGLEHTKKYVAVPGYSEHHTGLAADFCLYENNKWYIDHSMSGHPVLKIIEDNCYKFGFIIRYPLGKESITGYNNEPWHLRYIKDVDIAKYIMDNKICLEEYLEINK